MWGRELIKRICRVYLRDILGGAFGFAGSSAQTANKHKSSSMSCSMSRLMLNGLGVWLKPVSLSVLPKRRADDSLRVVVSIRASQGLLGPADVGSELVIPLAWAAIPLILQPTFSPPAWGAGVRAPHMPNRSAWALVAAAAPLNAGRASRRARSRPRPPVRVGGASVASGASGGAGVLVDGGGRLGGVRRHRCAGPPLPPSSVGPGRGLGHSHGGCKHCPPWTPYSSVWRELSQGKRPASNVL